MTENEYNEMLRKMRELKLPRFLEVYVEQHKDEPAFVNMPFADRLSILISEESSSRLENRTARLAKRAGLPIAGARFSELDDSPERVLNWKTLNTLRNNDYVRQGHNVIITGAAGSGKTFIASMLGNCACADGFKVHYAAAPDLCEALTAEMNAPRRTASTQKIQCSDLIIIDEFMLSSPTEHELSLIYRLLMDRAHKHSLIFCSHYAFDGWFSRMGGGVLVESILDRLRNASYMLPIISRNSMREKYERLLPSEADQKLSVHE